MKTFNEIAREAQQFGLTAVAVHTPRLGLTICAGGTVLGEALSPQDAEGLLYAYGEYVSGGGRCANGNCEI